MQPLRKPTWQQATALVSLSTCGAMTGFSFTHGTVAQLTSPASMPVHLVDLSKPDGPAAEPASEQDSALRSAIVNVANYYLRMAQSRTPAEMEALIWQSDSVDGVDHGESCAAFASLTLELGAKAAGQESWVSGGSSYPWPLHSWADVRVDENPASPNVISLQQDAESQDRWHPLGDGYTPQPGDWVLFDEHVEVVTKYASGVLSTIGGDSLPGFTVNAHQFTGSLADDGVVGFVNNGEQVATTSTATPQAAAASTAVGAQALPGEVSSQPPGQASQGQAAIPGTLLAALSPATGSQAPGTAAGQGAATATSGRLAVTMTDQLGATAIPGLQVVQADALQAPAAASAAGASSSSSPSPSSSSSASSQATATATAGVPGTAAQQAFISQVAPGAMAGQARYGIPAAVTIAQAIEESGWGQSALATQDHNLFGIKGTGPAGSDLLPTQEYQNGEWVTVNAPFRIYHNVAESIADHTQLLATGPSYQQAMADRQLPDAFAADLTGVYATDPEYGSNLIALMRLYNLYRYDVSSAAGGQAASGQAAGQTGTPVTTGAAQGAVTGGSTAGTATMTGGGGTGSQGGASIPGVLDAFITSSAATFPAAASAPEPEPEPVAAGPARMAANASVRRTAPRRAGGRQLPSPALVRTPQTPARTPQTPGRTPQTPGRTPQTPGRTPQTPGRTPQTPVRRQATPAGKPARTSAGTSSRAAGRAEVSRPRYVSQIPRAVTTDFIETAKAPLIRAEPLYRDVASRSGIRWELLAACDWMQCKAQPRVSPVHGEKLGTNNSDGTTYRTKSEALTQCANDLVELALAVYWIDITARRPLSVRKLASVFAAFRWGGLLKLHNVSAMEFPYSVEGLTAQNLKMRWPDLRERNAPDKPGSRFRGPFGAVPVVLSLDYPATDE